jgi:ABC-type nitrate/sulfonate/bicarbonate transport system substrate-binding protein
MDEQPKVGPTALGKLVLFAFVLACIGGAAYYFRNLIAPSGRDATGPVNMDEFKKVEAPDAKGITTVQEYKYVPGEKLPPVKGVSAYKWGADKVVNFPINVWIGWLPIVAANGGFSPNPDSIFAKKYGFKVNLKLIDDPVTARDAFAAGESHVLWGTLDMMVLFAPDLMKDSRSAPRIFQQVDWSSGGDGIVVRGNIASVADLKGKTIVYAQNSPSQYFINNLLLNAGVQPSAVKHKFTATAFEAAAAFVADKSIDACVSWAPDIYNIPDKVKGTRVLTTTAEANKLIADVWAARADFAKDHPEVIKGLVAGIFDGMDRLQDPTQREKAYAWMAEGYGMQADEVKAMANDAHSTNFAENKAFFLNANDPANFERTWKNVTFVYRELGPRRHADALRRGDGLRRAAGPRQGRHVRAPEGREPRELRADQLQEDLGRVADPHADDPHQLLSELGQRLRAAARRERQAGLEHALRPERRRHAREGGAARRPVRARGRRRGRPHRLVDEGQGHALRGREGALERPRRGGEAGARQEVQLRPEQVHGRGQGLGRAREPG